MSDMYNGWFNRETWAVHLYITNESVWHNTWLGRVAELQEEATERSQGATKLEADYVRFTLADELKDWVERLQEQAVHHDSNSDTMLMLFDIGSIWRVNWGEIAAALAEDAP